MDPGAIRFQGRWKEQLVISTPLGGAVVEMTMGELHVYFPMETRWRSLAPQALREKWAAIHGALVAWCATERIPLTVDEQAWVTADIQQGPA